MIECIGQILRGACVPLLGSHVCLICEDMTLDTKALIENAHKFLSHE